MLVNILCSNPRVLSKKCGPKPAFDGPVLNIFREQGCLFGVVRAEAVERLLLRLFQRYPLLLQGLLPPGDGGGFPIPG